MAIHPQRCCTDSANNSGMAGKPYDLTLCSSRIKVQFILETGNNNTTRMFVSEVCYVSTLTETLILLTVTGMCLKKPR